MRKQVLVSVDRGETRVAILECKKAAGGKDDKERRSKGIPKVNQDWRVAELYIEAPRPPVDRRERLQGPRRQRAGRNGGRLRRHRPREERLPTRGRDRHARRQDPAPRTGSRWAAHLRPAEVGPGDRRAGDQGPDRHEGRPPLDGGVDPGRYLVYVPDGDGVGVSRKLPDKEREQVRKLAAGLKLDKGGLIIHLHRPRRAEERHGARAAVPVPPPRGAREPGPGVSRADDGLPGGRPPDPGRARRLLARVRPRGDRRREAAPPDDELLQPHRARAGGARRALQGRPAAVRDLGRRRRLPRHALRGASTCTAAI